MPVREIDPGDRRERKRFVRFEQELLANQPLFVPEIASDVDKRLRGKSAFYDEMESTWFLASYGGHDVARCAALLNRRWQRDKGDEAGFIGYFAATPEATDEVAELLETAERWLTERGASRAIAPFNGVTLHGMGVLTDAFGEEPVFPLPWHPPHYHELLESAGYRPTYPLWIFDIDFSSERYVAASRRALERPQCTVRQFEKKRWDDELETLRLIFIETFGDEWEFHALTSAEFHEFFDELKPVFDPSQFLFAEVDGEIAGFCFGFPDWAPLFRSLRGKMGPLQIIRLLLKAKRFERAGLIAIGVSEAHRGKRIGQTLAATLYRRYEQLGLQRAFYYPVNDSNLASRRFAEAFGGEGRVLHHAYDKPLSPGRTAL